ncbi:hypothetical protein [uncultured Lacinutrix sp.]|uniref:hypothetical protein n=1 Tax=uncultured Lacinutrix sp. TaxID=574032 RepID=UPI00260C5D60|nr:hypothetical protein [uncultured Lacinutrix sp.]
MAVFKAIEKKMNTISNILLNVELIVKHLTKVFSLIKLFLKGIEFLLNKSRRVLIIIRKIIRAILSVLKRAGKFAGPLKVIIKPLRIILSALQDALKQFETIVRSLAEAVQTFKLLFILNENIRSLKKRLGEFIEKLRKKAQEIEELAKELEKQQKWLEKILPPAFIKKLWDLVKAISKPLDRIKKITKKIVEALKAFIKKLLGLQEIVDDLKEQFKAVEDFLKKVSEVTDTVNWILEEIEKFLKKIPGIGFVINVLALLGRFIDWLVDKTGVKDLLKWLVDKTGIIDGLAKGLKQITGAILELVKDFKKILDDIKQLFKDLRDLWNILTNLSGLLRLIAVLKWFFGFRIPNSLYKLKNGLSLVQNPDMDNNMFTSTNSINISVESVSISGKGIGNDWLLNVSIGETVLELDIKRRGNRKTNIDQATILEEVVSNKLKTIGKTIKISATEKDPVYDDHGSTTKTIKFDNKTQTKEEQIQFIVNASGGDAGASATITIVLKITIESIEDVLIPLSEAGRHNSGINYIEHALHDLKAEIGNPLMAPGLLKEHLALNIFIENSEVLLGKLKYTLFETPNNQSNIDKVIEEFNMHIENSIKDIVPEEEMAFDESYFINLYNVVKEEDVLENTLEFLFETSEEKYTFNVDACNLLDDETLFEPILTTDIADRPFDFNDNITIFDFIDKSNFEN